MTKIIMSSSMSMCKGLMITDNKSKNKDKNNKNDKNNSKNSTKKKK